jgi:hypothetical protein
MNRPTTIFALACALALSSTVPAAANLEAQESVTGGVLDLAWSPGFGISNNLQPLTLDGSHPAYANPSGDHTVGLALSSAAPDSGGIIVSCTDPGSLNDYVWEGWINTGSGNTRRGLILRANPGNDFTTFYAFVIESGMLTLDFRKLTGMGSTSLLSWLTTSTPTGFPTLDQWNHMRIEADGDTFRCYWNGYELPGTIQDVGGYASGWVGVYNFRFDLGEVPFLVDDLKLSSIKPVSVEETSWAAIKALYR